jgi:hypothetical protein
MPLRISCGTGPRSAPAWDRYRERLFEDVRPVSEWRVDQIKPQPGQTASHLLQISWLATVTSVA